MNITIRSNAAQVGAGMAASAAEVHAAVGAAVTAATIDLQTKVRARASGRPGPRAQTGDYRRSISVQVRSSIRGTTGEVGTNNVQGRRLEFGFWGLRDSLGRLFHQPPYPHFAPAADELERSFGGTIEAAAAGALQVIR